jgi:hypothetical protein
MLRTLAGDFSIASLLAGQIALGHLAAGRWPLVWRLGESQSLRRKKASPIDFVPFQSYEL